jgi:hypothetical protein
VDRPIGFQEVEALRFEENQHIKVGSLSTVSTSHEIFLVLISVKRLSRPQDRSAAGRMNPKFQ